MGGLEIAIVIMGGSKFFIINEQRNDNDNNKLT